MGRQPMGDEGRTVKATLRVTPQEERMLTDEFGSSGRGLRALVDAWWRGKPLREAYTGRMDEIAHERTAHPAIEDDDVEESGPPGLSDVELAFAAEVGASVPLMTDEEMGAALALDQVTQSLPPVDETKHRHKRGALRTTEWNYGTKVKVYECAEPGCKALLR